LENINSGYIIDGEHRKDELGIEVLVDDDALDMTLRRDR
jgi:hypothetical protein